MAERWQANVDRHLRNLRMWRSHVLDGVSLAKAGEPYGLRQNSVHAALRLLETKSPAVVAALKEQHAERPRKPAGDAAGGVVEN